MIHWHWHPRIAAIAGLQEFFETGEWRNDAIIVKQNSRRAVLYIPARQDRPGLYVKEDKPSCCRDRIKNLWRWKAREEFRSALELECAGLPVIQVLGWGIARPNSYLVSQEMPDCVPLATTFHEILKTPELRRLCLFQMANLINRMIRAEVDHPDLHGGNIDIASQFGQGSQITLWLPALPEKQ